MSKKPLIMSKVNIGKAPGFRDQGFIIDELCEGVNVVYGPNASGKTTFSRALFTSLWPAENDLKMNVTAHFTYDDAHWFAEVDGEHFSVSREGEKVTEMPVPAVEMKDRYLLSLHDMLQADTRGSDFAEAVMRETAGGYDLRKAMEGLGFKEQSAAASIKETKNVTQAVDNRKKADRKVQEVQEQEDELPALHKSLEDAQTAAERLEYYNKAITYVEAKEELEAVNIKFDNFPDVMERVSGDEYETLQELKENIMKQQEAESRAEEDLGKAREELEETGLDGEGASVEFLSRLEQLIEQLHEVGRGLSDYEQLIAKTRKKRDEIFGKMDARVQEEDLRAISLKDWKDFYGFAQDCLKRTAEREALERLKAVLEPEDNDDWRLQEIYQGAVVLVEWLTARSDAEGISQEAKIYQIVVIIALTALIALMAGYLTGGVIFGAIVLSAAVTAGILSYHTLKSLFSQENRIREDQQQRFNSLDLTPPERWERDAVSRRVTDLYKQYSEQIEKKERSDAWKGKQQKLEEVLAALNNLEEKKQHMLATFGMAPDEDPVSLVRFSEMVTKWQEEDAELQGAMSAREELLSQKSELLANIGELLVPFGYDVPGDHAKAKGKFDDLKNRQRNFEDAGRKMAAESGNLEDARAAVAQLKQERSEVFARLGVNGDDMSKVRRLCDMYSDYKQLCDLKKEKEVLLRDAEHKTRDVEDIIADFKERSLEELKSEAEELSQKAAQKDEIQQEINKISTLIDEAGKNTLLEEAKAEEDRALDALAARYTDDCLKVTGYHLYDYLQNRGSRTNRPEVFQRAETILTTITHGRYQLRLGSRGSPDFCAYDTVKEAWFALDELSSATRVQLLLAVRMAFVETQESSIQLPFVLDETLANTDDSKAGTVIDAAIELAKRGRQIFYLTAQLDEVGRWKASLEKNPDIEYNLIKLDDDSKLTQDVDLSLVKPLAAKVEEPPSPGGHDHWSYADVLEVPVMNPRQGAGATHVWYVVDAPDVIYRLLRLQVVHWGQLKAMIESGQTSLISDDSEIVEEISRNGAALEAFVKAWLVGRGDLVDRQVLEESGAVSETFIDRVAALARDVEGDGKELIKKLFESKIGFRSRKTIELEAYLESEGYIENIPPLDPDEVRRRVIHAFVETGLGSEEAVERAERLLERVVRRGEAERQQSNKK